MLPKSFVVITDSDHELEVYLFFSQPDEVHELTSVVSHKTRT